MKIEEVVEFLKSYRKMDEELHNVAPKESVSYHVTQKCLNYWDMAIRSLEAWEKIRAEIKKESEVKTLQLRWGEAMGFNKAVEIIDKYLEELEVQ